MHPQLEFADVIIRLLGWPFLIGTLIWVVRTWDRGQQQLKELETNTRISAATITMVKDAVSLIQTNHLTHLQSGMEAVAASNEKTAAMLAAVAVSNDKAAIMLETLV